MSRTVPLAIAAAAITVALAAVPVAAYHAGPHVRAGGAEACGG